VAAAALVGKQALQAYVKYAASSGSVAGSITKQYYKVGVVVDVL
jgi:hypothetical protein